MYWRTVRSKVAQDLESFVELQLGEAIGGNQLALALLGVTGPLRGCVHHITS